MVSKGLTGFTGMVSPWVKAPESQNSDQSTAGNKVK